MLILAIDADGAGRLVGRAVLADDEKELHEVSARIDHGQEVVKAWAEERGGKRISGGGDEMTISIPAEALDDVEQLRKDYEFTTGLTITVGVGTKLSEAGKALMVGKVRGKNMIVQYDPSIDEEISQIKDKLDQGTGSPEETKIGESYLKTEDKDTEHSCPHCEEYDNKNGKDFEHSDDCPHCQEYDQKNHEHSGDDCPHCKEYDGKQVDDDVQDSNATPAEIGKPDAIEPESAAPDSEESMDGAAEEDVHSKEAMMTIAQEIENQETSPSEREAMENIDDTDIAIGTNSEENVSRPEGYEDNIPGDMGLSEDEDPQDSPDLTGVLKDGLDNHADSMQREKVINMVSQALESFKAQKDVLEQAKERAPQLYESAISMLKAMIEMAKMLGLSGNIDSNKENPLDDASTEAPNKIEQKPDSKAAPKEGAVGAPKAQSQ